MLVLGVEIMKSLISFGISFVSKNIVVVLVYLFCSVPYITGFLFTTSNSLSLLILYLFLIHLLYKL